MNPYSPDDHSPTQEWAKAFQDLLQSKLIPSHNPVLGIIKLRDSVEVKGKYSYGERREV